MPGLVDDLSTKMAKKTEMTADEKVFIEKLAKLAWTYASDHFKKTVDEKSHHSSLNTIGGALSIEEDDSLSYDFKIETKIEGEKSLFINLQRMLFYYFNFMCPPKLTEFNQEEAFNQIIVMCNSKQASMYELQSSVSKFKSCWNECNHQYFDADDYLQDQAVKGHNQISNNEKTNSSITKADFKSAMDLFDSYKREDPLTLDEENRLSKANERMLYATTGSLQQVLRQIPGWSLYFKDLLKGYMQQDGFEVRESTTDGLRILEGNILKVSGQKDIIEFAASLNKSLSSNNSTIGEYKP